MRNNRKKKKKLQQVLELNEVIAGFSALLDKVQVPALSKSQLKGELASDFTTQAKPLLVNSLQALLPFAWDGIDLARDVKERIVGLLVSTDSEIVLLALEVLAAFQRYSDQPLVSEEDYSAGFFQYLAQGWAGNGKPLDLVSCVSGSEGDEDLENLASSLYFEFYTDKLTSIYVEKPSLEDCLGLFNRLVREFQVPNALRFALLTRIRFCRSFSDIESRHKYVRILILALELEKFHPCSRRVELLQQLPELVLGKKIISQKIQALALYAMKAHNITTCAASIVKSAGTKCMPYYLEALAFYSPSSKTIAWAFAEVIKPADGELDRLRHFLQLKNNHTRETRFYLAAWLRSFDSHVAGLASCLIVIFKDMEYFAGPVLRAAAGHFLTSSARQVFLQQVVSLNGNHMIDADVSVMKCFFKLLDRESESPLVRVLIERIVKDPEKHQRWIVMGLNEAIFASRMIESGGAKFLSALPMSVVCKMEEARPIHLKVKRALYQDFASKVRLFLVKNAEDQAIDVQKLELLARILDWLLFRCYDPKEGCNFALLEKLETMAVLEKFFAAVKKLIKLQSSAVNAPDMDIYFGIVRKLAEVAGLGWSVCSKITKMKMFEIVSEVVRRRCNLTAPMASAVSAVLNFKLPDTAMAAASLLKMEDILQKHHCLFDNSFVEDIWKKSSNLERKDFLRSLIDKIGTEDRKSYSFLAHLVSRDSIDAAELALEAGLPSRLLLKAKIVDPSVTSDVLTILDRLFRRLNDERGDPFTTWKSYPSIDKQHQAAQWLVNLIISDRPNDRQLPALQVVQILKLGENLTRDNRVARKVAEVDEENLKVLFTKILELSSSSIDAKIYGFEMMLHLLEDYETLYSIMSARIATNVGVLGSFLHKLSPLAFREPTIFLQAAKDSCQMPGKHNIGLKVASHDQSTTESDGTVSKKFMERFELFLGIARSPSNVVTALEFLSEIFNAVPGSVDAAARSSNLHSFLGRVLESCSVDDRRFTITTELIKIYARLGNPGRMPDVLCLLDPDHPEAMKVAASALSMLREQSAPKAIQVSQCRREKVFSASGKDKFRSIVNSSTKISAPDSKPKKVTLTNKAEAGKFELQCKHLKTLVNFLWIAPPFCDDDQNLLLIQILLFLLKSAPKQHALTLLNLLVESTVPSLQPFRLRGTLHGNGLWCRYHQLPNIVFERLLDVISKLVQDDPSRVTVATLLSNSFMMPMLTYLLNNPDAVIVHILKVASDQAKAISCTWKPSDQVLRKLCDVLVTDRFPAELRTLAGNFEPEAQVQLARHLANAAVQFISLYLEEILKGDYSCSASVHSFIEFFRKLCDTETSDDLADAKEELCLTLNLLWRRLTSQGALEKEKLAEFRAFLPTIILCHSMSSKTDLSLGTIVIPRMLNYSASVYDAPEVVRLLQECPGLLDFASKMAYLRKKFPVPKIRSQFSIRREHLLSDSLFQSLTPNTKIGVNFEGELAADAGGPTREWFQLVPREFVKNGLFSAVGESFQPNPSSSLPLSSVAFAGRMAAKAIIDDERLGINFTRSFYKHILGVETTYKDIEVIDPEFYRSIDFLLKNKMNDLQLGLTFSVDVETNKPDGTKKMVSKELIPNGQNIEVTDANKADYVRLMTGFKLQVSIQPQIDAFVKSFYELIDKRFISIFDAHELEQILTGLSDVDVEGIKRASKVEAFNPASPVPGWFWDVVGELSKTDKEYLLQFVTGSSKVPVTGLKTFNIVRMPQSSRLPSAHTCYNVIDLPEYKSKEELRSKLLLAIREGCEGFAFI